MALQARAYPENNLKAFPFSGNSQELFVENFNGNGVNGCGQNFTGQQGFQKQRNETLCLDGRQMNNFGDKRFIPAISHQPQGLPGQIVDQHAREIDGFLQLQSESLRFTLQEQRKRQTAEILRRMESKAQMLMTQKDQELASAARKTAELQQFLRNLEVEGEAWRRVVAENEAVVASLNNTLEELRRDSASSTAENRGGHVEEGTGENVLVETTGEEVAVGGACRGCGCRGACVLFLPCRHLCACGPCAAFLSYCPVCNSAKKACIEALIL